MCVRPSSIELKLRSGIGAAMMPLGYDDWDARYSQRMPSPLPNCLPSEYLRILRGARKTVMFKVVRDGRKSVFSAWPLKANSGTHEYYPGCSRSRHSMITIPNTRTKGLVIGAENGRVQQRASGAAPNNDANKRMQLRSLTVHL